MTKIDYLKIKREATMICDQAFKLRLRTERMLADLKQLNSPKAGHNQATNGSRVVHGFLGF